MVFAADKQIVAFLVKGHPVSSTIGTFFRPSVIALHHYGTSSVEKSFVSRSGDFFPVRIDSDQIGIGTSFADRNRRRLFWCDRLHLIVCAHIRLCRSVKVCIFRMRKLLHQRTEMFGRKDFTGEKNPSERAQVALLE